MTINSKQLTVGILLLVVGMGIGYLINCAHGQKEMRSDTPMPMGMMHHGGSMQDMMQGMTMSLDGKKGADFDKAFIDEMIVHHEGAVAMAKQALANAEHQEIKDLANAIITAQNKEIEQMKMWRAAWFK